MSLKKGLKKGLFLILAVVLITMIMYLILLLTSVKGYLLINIQIVLWCAIGCLYVLLPEIIETDNWTIAMEVFWGFIVTSFLIFLPYITALRIANQDVKSVYSIVLAINYILIYAAICILRYLNLIHAIKKINEKLLKK